MPVGVLDAAVSVNVVPVVDVAGLNAAVAPAGRPDAEKLTEPVKPFAPVTLMPSVPLVPCATLTPAAAVGRLNEGVVAGANAPVHAA